MLIRQKEKMMDSFDKIFSNQNNVVTKDFLKDREVHSYFGTLFIEGDKLFFATIELKPGFYSVEKVHEKDFDELNKKWKYEYIKDLIAPKFNII